MPANMKQIIADALVDLLKHKSIDKITVKDIVETCNISRQTFYYHFQDISEAMEWNMQQKRQQALTKNPPTEDPYGAIKSLVEVAIEHQVSRKSLMNSQQRESMEKLSFLNARMYFEELMQIYPLSPQISYVNREAAIDFCAGGLATMLILCDQKNETNANKLVQQIYQVLSCLFVDLPQPK